MAWHVEYSDLALEQLKKLDRSPSARIVEYLRATADSGTPRSRGKALTGPLRGYWRYRVGDYRVICEILDSTVTIIALDIDHRSTVYKR